MGTPPRVVKPRRALLQVGRKRPTMNLFGHGKTRKLASEDDLGFALFAAAGQHGASGLHFAYTNPGLVKQAEEHFNCTAGELSEVLSEPGMAKTAQAARYYEDAYYYDDAPEDDDEDDSKSSTWIWLALIGAAGAAGYLWLRKNPEQAREAVESLGIEEGSIAHEVIDTIAAGRDPSPDQTEALQVQTPQVSLRWPGPSP